MINFLLMDKMTNSDNPFKYGSAYNFSLEIELSVIKIVNKLLKLCSSKTEVEIFSNAAEEIPNMLLDCKKAKKELGWFPKYTFEQGLNETIEFYRSYFSEKK